MPLTSKGEEVMSAMRKEYGSSKGEQVFYASKNKGTIAGVDAARADELNPLSDRVDALNSRADTIADRDFEARRQDAVRSARSDISAVNKVEAGKVNPAEAGRFSRPRERGDASNPTHEELAAAEKEYREARSAPGAMKTYNDPKNPPTAAEKAAVARYQRSLDRLKRAQSKWKARGDDERPRERGDASNPTHEELAAAEKEYREARSAPGAMKTYNDPKNPPTAAEKAAVARYQRSLDRLKRAQSKWKSRGDDEMGRPDGSPLRDFDQAYQVGRKAGWNGSPKGTNPHSEPVKHEGWSKGWTDGYWERQNANPL
jgi:hypothetical protein